MLTYVTQRLAESAFVLLIMSFVVYGLIGLMPGDPIDIMVSSDPNMTPQDAARLRALYGLDRPIFERYLSWLGAVATGDLGTSFMYKQPVSAVLARALTRIGHPIRLTRSATRRAVAIKETSHVPPRGTSRRRLDRGRWRPLLS